MTGVPVRSEKRPRAAGAAPSMAATARLRADAMTHASPVATSVQTKHTPIRPASTLPAPSRATVPSGRTSPP